MLLASWTAHSTFADGTALHLKRDPLGFLAMGFTMSAQPLVRDAAHADINAAARTSAVRASSASVGPASTSKSMITLD